MLFRNVYLDDFVFSKLNNNDDESRQERERAFEYLFEKIQKLIEGAEPGSGGSDKVNAVQYQLLTNHFELFVPKNPV